MHFVICDDNKKFVVRCKKIIFEIMSKAKMKYDTIQIKENEISDVLSIRGNKVYICGSVNDKNGMDFAKKIRNSGDWNSPIIIVTDYNEFKTICHESNLLMLDYIFKDDDIDKNLLEALNMVFKISSNCGCLCIAKDSEMYQISYDDILYIEKRLNENYSTIVTEHGEYLVKKSIVCIYEKLNNYNFYKTHRSCIVNLNKIKMVDFDNNIIKFRNKQTNLISRANKKGLKKILDLQ